MTAKAWMTTAAVATGVVLAGTWVGTRAPSGPESPVTRVPAALWGELEPREIGRDTTWFLEHQEPGCSFQVDRAFDIARGPLGIYMVTGNHLLILQSDDLRRTRRTICRPVLGTFAKSDKNYYYTAIAVGEGVIGMGVEGGHGAIVMDDQAAHIIYQDEGLEGGSGAEIDRGLLGVGYKVGMVGLYSIAAIRDLLDADSSCRDHTGNRNCLVRLGEIVAPSIRFDWSMAGGLLAMANGFNSQVLLYQTMSIGASATSTGTAGTHVALWEHDQDTVLMATFLDGTLELRDVSCAAASPSSCPRLPPAFWAATGIDAEGRLSYSDGYLQVGGGGIGAASVILDVRGEPRQIDPLGYTDHYRQFRETRAYEIEVVGDRLIRAGYSYLDAHQILPPPAPPTDEIFADGFESGDVLAWSSTSP